jgi:hypothetical protein
VDGANSGATLFGDTISITGNTLTGLAAANVAIYCSRVHDVTITGNAVNLFGAGVYVLNVKKSAVITGNTFRNSEVYSINFDSASVLCYATITGNHIFDAISRGIYIGGAAGGVITGNMILNAGTTSGIYVLDNTGPMLIADNNVSASTPFFSSGTVTGLRVENNLFSTTITRSRTIASGVITAYLDWHTVDTESAAASDDLDTIDGGVDGSVLTLRAANSSRDVVMKDGTGNMKLNGDFTLNNVEDTITIRSMAGTWYELSRSDNGA